MSDDSLAPAQDFNPFVDGWRHRCEACGEVVLVKFSDGAPVRSEDVHTMTPLDGGDTLVLHNGCDRGDEASPILRIIPR